MKYALEGNIVYNLLNDYNILMGKIKISLDDLVSDAEKRISSGNYSRILIISKNGDCNLDVIRRLDEMRIPYSESKPSLTPEKGDYSIDLTQIEVVYPSRIRNAVKDAS